MLIINWEIVGRILMVREILGKTLGYHWPNIGIGRTLAFNWEKFESHQCSLNFWPKHHKSKSTLRSNGWCAHDFRMQYSHALPLDSTCGPQYLYLRRHNGWDRLINICEWYSITRGTVWWFLKEGGLLTDFGEWVDRVERVFWRPDGAKITSVSAHKRESELNRPNPQE